MLPTPCSLAGGVELRGCPLQFPACPLQLRALRNCRGHPLSSNSIVAVGCSLCAPCLSTIRSERRFGGAAESKCTWVRGMAVDHTQIRAFPPALAAQMHAVAGSAGRLHATACISLADGHPDARGCVASCPTTRSRVRFGSIWPPRCTSLRGVAGHYTQPHAFRLRTATQMHAIAGSAPWLHAAACFSCFTRSASYPRSCVRA